MNLLLPRPTACCLLALLLLGCAQHAAPPAAPSEQAAEGTAPAAAASRTFHLQQLGVAGWHAAGHLGAGLKVAVLDSGFRGYRDFLGAGLPHQLGACSFRRDKNLEARASQHGILCAATIHALAPRAELLLANWEPERPDTFLEAVRWARDQGARIVSCSVIMPTWSDGEGGGPIHAALSELATSGDLLLCASAGNIAERHWVGNFRPDVNGRHQWHDGDVRNQLTPWGRERVAVELYGNLQALLELSVYEQASRTLVAKARLSEPEEGCARAVLRFEPEQGAAYYVMVRATGASADNDASGRFHLVVLGAGLEVHNRHGSIPFPGDGPGVLAVGAVDATGCRSRYSSCGPNSSRPKPDFVALVPFPSLCRAEPFDGTSAAAPQAAGLAALLWARHPHWNAAAVNAALRATAEDLGPPGHDFETGHGLLNLNRRGTETQRRQEKGVTDR